jgi:hypothetical protein
MCNQDAGIMWRSKMHKTIKAQILELHSARGGPHGNLLRSTNKFNTYLNGADGWLFSDECDIATLEEMVCWWDNNNRSRTEEMYTVFYAAKCEYTMEKDQNEMEEGLEPPKPSGGNTDGEGNNEDDHHTRWLPTKYRMEIVMKNENEAKELSSGDNYQAWRGQVRAKALSPPQRYLTCHPRRRRRRLKRFVYLCTTNNSLQCHSSQTFPWPR